MKKKLIIVAAIIVMSAAIFTSCGQEAVDYTDIGTKIETVEEALEVIESLNGRTNFVLQTVKTTDVSNFKKESKYLLERCESGVRITTHSYNEISGSAKENENVYYYIMNGDTVEYCTEMGGEYITKETDYESIEDVVSGSEEYLASFDEIMNICIAANWDEESKTFKYVNEDDYGYSISVVVYTGAVAYVKEDIAIKEEIMFCGFGQVNVEKPKNSIFGKLSEAFR